MDGSWFDDACTTHRERVDGQLTWLMVGYNADFGVTSDRV